MSGPTYSLVLTAGQAEQLNRVNDHRGACNRGALPHRLASRRTGGRRAEMQRYLQAMTGAPSLELPFSALREWLRQQENVKP